MILLGCAILHNLIREDMMKQNGFTLAEGATHVALQSVFSKAGFTLAEVLITLGIIGVVAAMTIPNLIQNYQEKMFVNKLNQSYSQLLQAFRLMVDEYGTIDTWTDDTDERKALVYERLPQFIKISSCDRWKCLGKSYTLEGDVKSSRNLAYESDPYSMQNGSVLVFPTRYAAMSGECTQNMAMDQSFNTDHSGQVFWGTYMQGCGKFYVDLNGSSGPNIFNFDTFLFKIVKDGIVPAGGSKENIWTDTFSQCLGTESKGHFPGYCTAWVIENKNMDYRHCKNLSWTGSRSCR